jgi:ATP-dependent helicase HepA
VAGQYEAIGLFEEPLGGLERELRHVARAVQKEALHGPDEVDPAVFEGVLKEAQEAHDRVRQAAYHELHRDPYRPEMAGAILARVPPDLDLLNESVVLRAAGRFGFLLEQQSGERVWSIEFGWEALVDHIPGVPPGSRYLGTFDRAEAVERETLDYFASGHPLVEGVLLELEEGPRGQVAVFQVPGEEEVFGLLALYKRGADFEVVVVDRHGRPRPDLAERLTARGVVTEPVEAKKWTAQAGWAKAVHRMAAALPEGKPQAVAAFRVRKEGAGSSR